MEILIEGQRKGDRDLMMKNMLYWLAPFLFIFGFASKASARTVWSTSGTGCIVDTGSSSKASTSTIDGSMTFASGQTGTYEATCIIPTLSFAGCVGTTANVYITATDSDTSGTNTHAYAELRYVNKDGAASVGYLAYVYSNAFVTSSTARTKGTSSAFGSFSFSAVNFASNYYWIAVDMYRSSTSNNSTMWGISIECADF